MCDRKRVSCGLSSGLGSAVRVNWRKQLRGCLLTVVRNLRSPLTALALFVSAPLGLLAQSLPVSITPTGQTGSTGTFTAMYTDPNGGADIAYAEIYIMGNNVVPGGATGWSSHQCILEVERATGGMYIVGDAGGAWVGTTTMGTQTVLSNSQCTFNAANTMVVVSGDTLTVTFSVTFNEGNFGGAKQLYLGSASANGTWATNYQHEFATFTVPSATIPTGVSVTPSGQTGGSATFTATFSDAAGGANITSAVLDIMNNIVPGRVPGWSGHECELRYDPGTTDLYLVTDTGGAYTAPIKAGSSGVLSNSQCNFSAAGTSATVSGNTLTVKFAVTFNTTNFAGAKQLYLSVGNSVGWSTNYQTQLATWSVPGNTTGNIIISGQVLANGAAVPGVIMDLSGASTGTVNTDSNGNYSFTVAAGGTYTITPSSPSTGQYTFSPENYTFTDVVANTTGSFTATAVTNPTQTDYTIGGQVLAAGYPLPGVTLTLTGASLSMPVTTLSGGTGGYSFTVAAGQTYTVTPSLSGYSFTPASRTYANIAANQTTASFASTTGSKPPQPTSSFTVLVNGSFDEDPTWEMSTDPEYQAIQATFGGTISAYHWTGDNIF